MAGESKSAVAEALGGELKDQLDAYTASRAEGFEPDEEIDDGATTEAPSEDEGGAEPEGTTVPEGETASGAEGEKPAGTEEEPPFEYMGTDLRDFSADQRRTFIAAVQEQERVTHAAQREAADARRTAEQQAREKAAVPEPVSDDDLMRQLGFDPDDPMYEVQKEASLPLARRLAALETQVQTATQQQELERFTAWWETTLDNLETSVAKLPEMEDGVDPRESFLQFAIDNDISDPEDAYYRYMGPKMKAVSSKAAEARKAALDAIAEKKRAAASSRPSGSAAVTDAEHTPKSKTVKGAVKEFGPDILKALNLKPDDVIGMPQE